MIQTEAKWILDYIKTDIGVGVWFSYFDVRRMLQRAGIDFTEPQFKKWMTSAAFLADEEDLCLAHPTEATNFQAILVTAAAENAEKVTDAYLHVARTNTGVAKRLGIYVDYLEENSEPGSDGSILAKAAKGLTRMQEVLTETVDGMNRDFAEKRRKERRALREAQAIEAAND